MTSTSILILGGGGREHALLWALRRESPERRFFVAPGNPGTAEHATNLAIPVTDFDRLEAAVDRHDIGLVIVGPEVPLAAGLADRLAARRRAVFGPVAAAARIEASKAFAKEIMKKAGVPTAASRTFRALPEALAWVDRHPEPLVVKASGLAAGKGAVVCETRREAAGAVRAMMETHALGIAGDEIVIEEFMEGEELSVFAITDGRAVTLLPGAQDHKRLLEGDRGPNTGGMGAYAPVSIATPDLMRRIERDILLPTLAALEREGARYRGLLYAGLMIGRDGAPRVVEFNCRFGDPETQAVLPLVSGGLLEALDRVARGEAPSSITADTGNCAVTTVLASRGYPERPETGAEIRIPAELPRGVTVFHAGTARDESGTLRTSGGRVLNVTAVAPNFREARERSRLAADRIGFDGKQFRQDIGWREEARSVK